MKNVGKRELFVLVAVLLLSACQGEEPTPSVQAPTSVFTNELSTEGAATEAISPTETDAITTSPAIVETSPPLETPPSAAGQIASPSPTGTESASEELIPTATPKPEESVVETVTLEEIADGLEKPTYITHAFDERLFVTEQVGKIRIIENGQLSAQPFLDITERVGSAAFEQGLLSTAFSPNYQQDGRFYVNYTNLAGDTVVSRFAVNPEDRNSADPASEEILLRISQPYGNHNGGQLQFGSDNMLYIGMGDGGSAGDPLNNGQDSTTLLGSLLRIDVDQEIGYAIPADNPFTGDLDIPDEIWATGLRNPWRFSFDRLSGDLYLSDVGQSVLEEVNFIDSSSPGGQNFGWNIMEGTSCYDGASCSSEGLVLPVFEYNHQEGGCSITGGYIYRGSESPALIGNYFLGDYCSGFIWSLFQESDGVWVSNRVNESGMNISTFGEDAVGELYIANHSTGTIYKIRP